jgi:uncharacterized protein
MTPTFPNFKKLELSDREIIQKYFWDYQPETSELMFTNIFIWRNHYGFHWAIYKDWLVVVCSKNTPECYSLPPIGPGNREKVTTQMLNFLRTEKKVENPKIERADERLIAELATSENFQIEETPKHFDYIYNSEDLIKLEGRKFKQKRNHINKFLRESKIEYTKIDDSNAEECMELSNKWCMLKANDDVKGEWEAVNEALKNFNELQMKGGVIKINGKVEAFALGEKLNDQTAVIHIEKANTEIPGIYAIMNQQFAENEWSQTSFINREQDLGIPGLRKAKESYNPVRLVKKFRIESNQ